MDEAAIARELGVSRKAASKIMQWCARRGGIIAPPTEELRKTYVLRADVEAWERENTRRVA